ncbi:non-structural maintenance of chromosomes element 1 family protein [Aspergillus lucknowensis]|uniref:Non-structural maintenance of chromosomes element 1 homolog n=1 Tax=Aspergillus lucknowensis TaxID=176173 RepID=A0ABR4LHL4_9EURO
MADGRVGHRYDDSNRAFLQALMARSTITFEESKPLLAAILSVRQGEPVSEDDITEEHLSSFIGAANAAISPFDLEIRSTLPQIQINDAEGAENAAPERVYALVNTTSDGLTQLATTYTADDISFIKRILDKMFEANNNRITEGMAISSIEAVQLAKVPGEASRRESGAATQQTQGGAAQSLSMTQAEVVMKQLVEDGWMEKSRRGYYTLSPRGLMELRGWLVATYNDEDGDGRRHNKIKFCAACKDIITVGQRCGNRECGGRLHDHCMRNFFRVQKAEQCPVCRAPWPGNKFVGERAITSGQNRRNNNPPRRSAVGPSTQETQLTQSSDPVNEDMDGEDSD